MIQIRQCLIWWSISLLDLKLKSRAKGAFEHLWTDRLESVTKWCQVHFPGSAKFTFAAFPASVKFLCKVDLKVGKKPYLQGQYYVIFAGDNMTRDIAGIFISNESSAVTVLTCFDPVLDGAWGWSIRWWVTTGKLQKHKRSWLKEKFGSICLF